MCAAGLQGHDIITTKLTFTRDISRIFARHCVSCHGENSSIPLVSYEQARPWAVDIKEQVLNRLMPPWGAVKGFGNLAPDRGLSQEDILIIAAWVVGGAPRGNPDLAPKSTLASQTSPPPQLKDVLHIDTRAQLEKPLQLAGIRPLAQSEVASARIIACYPDGRMEPLLWLYRYNPKFEHAFTFQKPLALPAGTLILSDAPLSFALLKATGTSPGS